MVRIKTETTTVVDIKYQKILKTLVTNGPIYQ